MNGLLIILTTHNFFISSFVEKFFGHQLKYTVNIHKQTVRTFKNKLS